MFLDEPSLADRIQFEYGGIDSASYVAPVPSLPSGWSLPVGVSEAAKTVTDLIGSGFGAVAAWDNLQFARQARQVDLQNRSAAIDINKSMTGAQVEIAKLQASGAVKAAQRQEANAGLDLSTILGNVNARISGMSKDNGMMMWLAVAGVGFAALQYFKGRK